MKRLKYTTENIMMFLREKDIFDLNEVEFAIIEGEVHEYNLKNLNLF